MGGSELNLPPVVFGAMAHHGAEDEERRVALMRAAVDAGYRAFDTAPLYGFGASERQLGRAIEGRDDVLVLSKVGLTWTGDHGDVLFSTATRTVRKDSRPTSVLAEIEQSLERLRRDRIDLVQLHHPDTHVPIDETVGALLDARAAGKIGAIGVSNFSPSELRAAAAALGDVPLFSAQDGYHLLERGAEQRTLPVCRQLGCAFLAFSPLAQGALARGPLERRRLADEDWRASDPKFAEVNRASISSAIRAGISPVAERHDASHAQVALAWLLAQPGVTSVIAGARTAAHLRANLGAADLELSVDELASMRRAFEALELADPRSTTERAKELAKRGLRGLRRLLDRS